MQFTSSNLCFICLHFRRVLNLAMLSTMSSEYTITEGPYSFKELASKVKLPQMVLVTHGFCGATEKDTISCGQVMVAFFVKRVKGVTGIHKKRSFHIPLNSAMQFAPVPLEGKYHSCTSTTICHSSMEACIVTKLTDHVKKYHCCHSTPSTLLISTHIACS